MMSLQNLLDDLIKMTTILNWSEKVDLGAKIVLEFSPEISDVLLEILGSWTFCKASNKSKK